MRLEDLIAKLQDIDRQKPNMDVVAEDCLTNYGFEVKGVKYDSNEHVAVIEIDDQGEN